MSKLNVLFVGGGRRVSLAKKFIENGFNIYGYEINNRMPLSSVGKIICGKDWKDPEIYSDIKYIIDKYKINLLLPLQDEAVTVCSKIHVDNCVTLASDFYPSSICLDKKLFEEFCLNYFPDIYPKVSGYPKIAKPRFGFGSRGIAILNNEEDEKFLFRTNDRDSYILQKFVQGTEYSVDTYFDNYYNAVDSVSRKRARVGSGEVITSITERQNNIIYLAEDLGHSIGLIGPVCSQFIVTPDGNPFVLEVNSRFGGGSTLSIEAGLDFIKLIKSEYFGYNFKYTRGEWKNNLLMERSFEDFFYEDSPRP
jgi:carbamoyl-phosphate synthase large subunit